MPCLGSAGTRHWGDLTAAASLKGPSQVITHRLWQELFFWPPTLPADAVEEWASIQLKGRPKPTHHNLLLDQAAYHCLPISISWENTGGANILAKQGKI